jgi:hypothetical protein
MPGFKNIRAYVDAPLSGAEHFTTFRKVPSQPTTAGNWCDLSMAGGTPVPNYYAASPLEAATLGSLDRSVRNYEKGIFHGADVAPAQKHLRNLCVMTPTANAVPSYWYLMDYLLFYPFIDMDSLDTQEMVNTVTLPRYATGNGVRMMMVNLAPTTGGGQFTVTYTNQAGTAGQVTPLQFCTAATSIATLTATTAAPGGFQPFIPLASGDTGVRSVQSVTFTVVNGGLCALVLVKPLRSITIRDINAPTEKESIREVPDAPRIYDGAYLNLIGMTTTGSIAAGTIAGYAEFVWG